VPVAAAVLLPAPVSSPTGANALGTFRKAGVLPHRNCLILPLRPSRPRKEEGLQGRLVVGEMRMWSGYEHHLVLGPVQSSSRHAWVIMAQLTGSQVCALPTACFHPVGHSPRSVADEAGLAALCHPGGHEGGICQPGLAVHLVGAVVRRLAPAPGNRRVVSHPSAGAKLRHGWGWGSKPKATASARCGARLLVLPNQRQGIRPCIDTKIRS